MSEINTLKAIRISSLAPEHLVEITRITESLSPNLIIDSEHTLADIYKNLKKESKKAKLSEKKLKEAEKIILSIAGIMKGKVEGRVQPIHHAHHIRRHISPPRELIETLRPEIQKVRTITEARKVLADGNRRFLLELGKYESHHERLETPRQYDVIILACSDSRNLPILFRDFVNQGILVLTVAGNVYEQGNALVESAISRIKDGGTVVVLGHSNCGAVNAKKHPHEAKPGSHVPDLLGAVDLRHSFSLAHDSYEDNAVNQAAKLQAKKMVVEKHIRVVPCVFDFTNGESKILNYIGEGNEPQIVSDLRASAISRVEKAGALGSNLDDQNNAHTILVYDPTAIGRFSDPRLLVDANMGDVFAVAVRGTKPDTFALASIEYALEHLGLLREIGNIVILNGDKSVADQLERELKSASILVRSRGKVSIAILDDSGAIVFA